MGQSFVLLNLDKRQHWHMGKLGESIFEGGRDAIFKLGYVVHSADKWKAPRMSRYRRVIYENRRRVADPAPGPPSVFMRLSNELMSMVFDQMEDCLIHVAFLALTCMRLWNIGVRTLARLLDATATWTGDRVICLGDYTQYDDLPANLLTDAERAIVEAHMEAQDEPEEWQWYCYNSFIHLCATNIVSEPCTVVRKALQEAEWDHMDDYDMLLRAPSQVWSSLVETNWRPTGPSGMALRNLVTREYVRGAKLLRACKEAGELWGENGTYFDFGDLLLLRMCWSSQPGCSLLYGELRPMTRGPWAGHRFDIVDEADVVDDAGWKDVSSELTDDMLVLFESEYGH